MQHYFTLPEKPLPVCIIGAGGIVNDAHLPAYRLAGFNVAGIFDIDNGKATSTAEKFSVPHVYASLEEMVKAASAETVFDMAVPGDAVVGVLSRLPDRASVLIQKPMGNNYEEAKQILSLAEQKRFTAGVNFQLRYAPFITEARNMIRENKIGQLCDVEVYVNVYTPWHLWKFLYSLPRVEILYHSIHYIDLIRSFLGDPQKVYAKTTKHPSMEELAFVRTTIIMDYGDRTRADIHTNHCHNFGLHNQDAYIKFEGTRGAIKIRLGLLMNYPQGVPDKFEYVILEDGKEPEWKTRDIQGSWFPHAFIGSMAQVMLAASGTIAKPDNSFDDCIKTMACVEAAYKSSECDGVKPEVL